MSKPAETILSSIFKPIMNRLISLSDSSAKVNEKVTVPALTGKSVEKAKEDANNAGVSVEVIGTGKNVSRQSVGAGVKRRYRYKDFPIYWRTSYMSKYGWLERR